MIDLLLKKQVQLNRDDLTSSLQRLFDLDLISGEIYEGSGVRLSIDLIRRWMLRNRSVEPSRSETIDIQRALARPNYSAFDNGFKTYRLRSFSEKELLDYLFLLESTDQPPFSSKERQFISFISGSHPHLVRLAAATIFDQRLTSGAPLSDLNLIESTFKVEASRLFRELWDGASDIEQLLLMLISLQSCQGKLKTAEYHLGDLPELSRYDRELNELVARGLLNRTQDNPPVWDLFSPVFLWWILKEIESTAPNQLSERRKVWGRLVTDERAQQISGVVDWVRQNRALMGSVIKSISDQWGINMPQLPPSDKSDES